MSRFGIMEDLTAEVMRERRQAAERPHHAVAPRQSEIRVRWKLRADREGVGPRWPW
jgi:hypothetical protein